VAIEITGEPIPSEAVKVLTEILGKAGVPVANVTSVARTPLEQVQIMCRNEKKNMGSEYGPIGRSVLQVYSSNKNRKCKDIAPLMEAELKRVLEIAGSQRSEMMHVQMPGFIVFDIAIPASEEDLDNIVSVASSHPKVTRFLHPKSVPRDPTALHFEMKRH
jgi:hypothetical protein